MRRFISGVIVAGVLGWLNAAAFGGECVEGPEAYVTKLEHYADTRPLDGRAEGLVSEALGCLAGHPMGPWAGPVTAQHFQNLRESPLRPRIVAACAHYLDIPHEPELYDPGLAYEAADVLAMYGVAHADQYDVLEILVAGARADHRQLPYPALAAMGDPRVLPLLKATYDSLDAASVSQQIQQEKSELINCLYHVPGDSAVALAKAIRKRERDPAIKERAERVIHR